MNKIRCIAGFLAGVLAAGTAVAEQDYRAYMLASSCFACHGTDGRSPGAIPSLNGKSREFIEVALKSYKSGESQGTVMNRLARGYSEEEIALIAEYFSGLK